MDAGTRSTDDGTEGSNQTTVNVRRRSLLGGATTGGIMAASMAAMALLRSNRAEASGDPGGYYVYNAVTDFGAKGDGTTDDTTALQNAINAASGQGNLPLYIPNGTYKITTALTIPVYTKIFGADSASHTIIQPHGCGLFILDGSLYSGAWVQGICINSLSADLTNASATNAVYINRAYDTVIRDCNFYFSGPNVACNTLIQGCNNVVLDNVILAGYWNNISSNPLGLSIVGPAGNPCSVKLVACNCEYFAVAMQTSGTAYVDMFSPYSESSGLSYLHGITGGQVSIHGGELLGGNGLITCNNCVNIQGNNLAIYGTFFSGFSAAIFAIANSPTFNNVKVFSYGSSGGTVLAAGSNLASIECNPPLVAGQFRSTVDFTKNVTTGVLTNLLSFSNTYLMKCRLTISLLVGAATACAQFDFVLGSGLVPNVVTSAVSKNYNANWTAFWGSSPTDPPAPVLTVTLQNSTGLDTYTFALTAYAGGALATPGGYVTLFGQLDFTSYDPYGTSVVTAL